MTATNINNSDIVYSVLVHYKNLNDTIECIESLLKQHFVGHQIICVDNGSHDDCSQTIKSHFPQITILENKKNLGFTGGYNVGIRYALQSNADYIFIVNNDTITASDVIEKLIKVISNNKEIGVVSPIIYCFEKPDQIWSAGGKVSKLTLDMTDNHGRKKTFSNNTERDFLSGCAVMFKREVLENVGLFDGTFFSYYEDYDLSFRIKKAGYKQFLVPEAKIWHKVSQAGGGVDNPAERYFMARNGIIFYRKYAKPWQLLFIIPFRIGSIVRTLIRLILKKKYKSIQYYVLGLFDGLKQTTRTDIPLFEKE